MEMLLPLLLVGACCTPVLLLLLGKILSDKSRDREDISAGRRESD